MLDIASLIRAMTAEQSDQSSALRVLRDALPEFADTINGMLIDALPCAFIGLPNAPKRNYGRYDREGIDAQAEREGSATDWLTDNTPARPSAGRGTSQWDYQRAARRESALLAREDADVKTDAHKPRYQYRRTAAIEAWYRILAYFNASPEDRRAGIVTLPVHVPQWARDESPEVDAERAANRLRRQLIRGLGALAMAGFPGAREKLEILQPSGRVRMRR